MDSAFTDPNVPRFSVRGLLLVTVVVALIVAVFGGVLRDEARRRADEKRFAEEDAKTRTRLVDDINAICATLGRVPEDQNELERLLGGHMPEVHLGPKTMISIFYFSPAKDRFKLNHLIIGNGDLLVYDSATPKAGWTPIFD